MIIYFIRPTTEWCLKEGEIHSPSHIKLYHMKYVIKVKLISQKFIKNDFFSVYNDSVSNIFLYKLMIMYILALILVYSFILLIGFFTVSS